MHVDKKEQENKIIDNMRSMMASLSQSIKKSIKISQIDNKKPENKFTDNMRSMTNSLSQSINKISEIDNKISQINEKEQENKFIDNINLGNKYSKNSWIIYIINDKF